MFGKLKDLFNKKDSKAQINERLSKKLHNMHIKYISERLEDGSDKIILRDGHMNIVGDKGELLVATEGVKTVLKIQISQMDIWEFMSLNGCNISFTDLDSGKARNVSVYYDAHLIRT